MKGFVAEEHDGTAIWGCHRCRNYFLPDSSGVFRTAVSLVGPIKGKFYGFTFVNVTLPFEEGGELERPALSSESPFLHRPRGRTGAPCGDTLSQTLPFSFVCPIMFPPSRIEPHCQTCHVLTR